MVDNVDNFYIYGAGGFALQIWDTINSDDRYQSLRLAMRGFIDLVNPTETLLGFPVFHTEKVLFQHPQEHSVTACFIGFGAQKERITLFQRLKKYNLLFPSIFHPTAVISPSSEIQDGVFIAPLSIIGPLVKIGFGCIVNDATVVSHNDVLGDYVQVCPNVSLGGNVLIEEGSFIGIGSVVLPKKTIREYSTIGAGALVTKDIPRESLAYGVPAKIQ